MSDAPSPFFSRWSRLKTQAQQAHAAAPASPESTLPALKPASPPESPPPRQPAQSVVPDASAPPPPAPTLADVAQLTPDADFSSYMARSVAPEVKNAALKKLFTDPHFNVMDRMDVYIDDYSLPDPLSPQMLREMVSAQFLKLTEDAPVGDTPASAPVQSVAQSPPDPSSHDAPDHDHADLRLQPDAAPEPPGAAAKPD